MGEDLLTVYDAVNFRQIPIKKSEFDEKFRAACERIRDRGESQFITLNGIYKELEMFMWSYGYFYGWKLNEKITPVFTRIHRTAVEDYFILSFDPAPTILSYPG